MTDKEKMMRTVYANGFAADEARLFLDTHPEDPDAIAYFEKKVELYNRAVDQYQQKYGVIRPENGVNEGRWAWGLEPWPWEGGM